MNEQGRESDRGDHRSRSVEILISNVLRSGVLASFLLVVLGTVLTYARSAGVMSAPGELLRLTRPGAPFPHSVGSVLAGVTRLDGASVVLLGLLVLVATPVIRVALSVAAFAVRRDRTYTLITLTVLALLLASLAVGGSG